MSELTADEEKKILLLEQAEQQQKVIEDLIENSKQQQGSITALINSRDETIQQLMEEREQSIQQTGRIIRASIDQTSERTLTAVAEGTRRAVKGIIAESINDVTRTMNKGINRAEKSSIDSADSFVATVTQAEKRIVKKSQEIEEYLSWKLLAIWGGAVFLISIIALVFYVFYVPSPSEVSKLKADYEKYSLVEGLVINNCDGKACVKVQTDKCNYGASQKSKVRFCLIPK